jgi:tRNA pseudouridine38-40 synthase
MRRIRIVVSYDGTEFHGWQVQPDLATVQGTLERVVSEIEGSFVRVEGSGRTDAGVHALAQVAAFSIDNPIPVDNLRKAMNRLLPASVRVCRVDQAAAEFHPRFDAHSKVYEYRIWRGEVCPPFERRYVYHHPYPFDEAGLIAAASVFEGEHDFSAFAAADERDLEGGSKVRTVFSSCASRSGDLLVYRVRGSGFLKHMVRNLVGTLLEVGKGNRTADGLRALLAPGAAVKAGPTAPARGLFLVDVHYS